jgi:hypothetical protein
MVVFGMYLVYIMGGIRSVGDPALFFTIKKRRKRNNNRKETIHLIWTSCG